MKKPCIGGKRFVAVGTQSPVTCAARCDGPLPLPSVCGGDECDDCGTRCGPDECGPDPYRSEIHNDDMCVLKCQACRRESAAEL